MNSESGFLKTRQHTESGGTSAGSPIGREKSTRGPSSGSTSARAAASKPPRNGQGKTIGGLSSTSAMHPRF
jgi:hypothetical protein